MKLAGRALALLLLGLVAQRIGNWPLPHTWEIGIGATEWGAWLFVLAVLLALPFRRDRLAVALLALSAGIVILPCLRASFRDPGFSWLRLFQPDPKPALSETVTYSGSQQMDLYRPAGPPRGTVIVVHGGSWCRGSRTEFQALNVPLTAMGFLVASVDYRLAPQNVYPAACEDLDAAWDFLVAHGSDPRRMVWLGRSAGAHLALLEAYARRPSAAAIAFYPPTDMQWSYDHPSNPRVLDSTSAIRDFMGGPPGPLYAEASPLRYATAESPPTLLLHGDADDLVYPAQSERLAARLPRVQHVRIPWGNHGFDVHLNGPSGQLSTLAVQRFLQQFLP